MLTIGEFSRLGNISTRMLRHYDAMGLLCPVRIGAENGYRYYDGTQLSILGQIETLKSYGFALGEIRELLPLSPEDLGERIHTRRIQAYEELNRMRKSLRRMEEDILRMEGHGGKMDKYHVIEMNAPEQKVFCIRKTIDIGQVRDLFQDLLSEAASRGFRRTGPTQMAYLGEAFSYDNMDVEAQVQVEGEGEGIKVLPAGLFLGVTHIGPYESIHFAYEALGDWSKSHPEYTVRGQGIERYIKDGETTSNPEEYETGVLFPVEKK